MRSLRTVSLNQRRHVVWNRDRWVRDHVGSFGTKGIGDLGPQPGKSPEKEIFKEPNKGLLESHCRVDRAGTDTDGGKGDRCPEQGTVYSLESSQRLMGGKSEQSTHTPESHRRDIQDIYQSLT